MDADTVIKQIRELSPEETRKIQDYLETNGAGAPSGHPPSGASRRQAGLHRGSMEIGPDFDAPFPENFWMGEE